MDATPSTPWHRASFDRFLHQTLQEVLTERLHVTGYRAVCDGENMCDITLSAGTPDDSFDVVYGSLPVPDESGVFHVDGAEWVVTPVADGDDPSEASVKCVGEQIGDFVASRLGQVPADAELDELLVRTLAPLDAWFRAFLAQTSEVLRATNWLDRHTHLRRLLMPDRTVAFTTGHFGRTCPFETPEGPNIARILTISRGAEIQNGRLAIVDDGPAAGLGLAAAAIPFVEHDDANRVLMGANMMRQWRSPSEREPALVQTGLEPEDPEFWCGRNLLTAFTSWDGYAFEDAVVISETCASKLSCPEPLEPGDKLSNRHGTKGVVGQVLPDSKMPCLDDGTPVELIYSLSGVPTRWEMGQIREAVAGRVARTKGRGETVPPFGAPSSEALRNLQEASGLPESGMELLTDDGKQLRRPTTVGWVYWGCTDHLARNKIRASVSPGGPCQRVGRMEVEMLEEAGAYAVIRDLMNTCSSEREDAATLADRVEAGEVAQPDTPSPGFARLVERLSSVGISTTVGKKGVQFRLQEGCGRRLDLARPVAHPWLSGVTLAGVPIPEDDETFEAVKAANNRLSRLLEDAAPESLVERTAEQLSGAVRAVFDGALSTDDLRFGGRVLFSGRSVLAPGPDLRFDQLGLPEDMAWRLFGPRVPGILKSSDGVEKRTDEARATLEKLMAESWVILNRAPSVTPTALLAFHPVLCRGNAIRMHPLACRPMNADFDGDQGAVHLPISKAAQKEAGEKLSLAGHLGRDARLVEMLVPSMDALFGLACLSRSAEGRKSVTKVAGREIAWPEGVLTRDTVVGVLGGILNDEGPEAALGAAERLVRLGFKAARAEGGTIGPFLGFGLEIPEPPSDDDLDQWLAYQEEIHAIVAGFSDYDDEDFGAVALLSHCGARGSIHQVAQLISPQGPVYNAAGQIVEVRGCWRDGLTATEAMARVVGARNALFRMHDEFSNLGKGQEARERPEGYGVLARARRASNPGVVFARAAASREVDPLEDRYARLFVGIQIPVGRAFVDNGIDFSHAQP